MSLIAGIKSKRPFVNPPVGMAQAVCVDVEDLGIEVPKNKNFAPAHKVRFYFQLAEVMTEEYLKESRGVTELDEQDQKLVGRRFVVTAKFTLSLADKSLLKPFLENWRGKKFNEAEKKGGFDIERMIGANAFLNIVHADSATVPGVVYANIGSVMPFKATPSTPLITPDNYTRKQDRENARGAAAGANSTPEVIPVD